MRREHDARLQAQLVRPLENVLRAAVEERPNILDRSPASSASGVILAQCGVSTTRAWERNWSGR